MQLNIGYVCYKMNPLLPYDTNTSYIIIMNLSNKICVKLKFSFYHKWFVCVCNDLLINTRQNIKVRVKINFSVQKFSDQEKLMKKN